MAVTKSPSLANWRDWIKQLEGKVVVAHLDEEMTWEFFRILNGIPDRTRIALVSRCLQRLYEAYAAIALRRLVDRDHKTYSLWRLLKHLSHHWDVFTLAEYLADAPVAQIELEREHFQGSWSDSSGKRLCRGKVERDLRRLDNVRDRLGMFDRRLVHLDNVSANGPPVTWRRLERCNQLVEGVYAKYYRLLTHGAWPGAPMNVNDWWQALSKPLLTFDAGKGWRLADGHPWHPAHTQAGSVGRSS